MLHVKILTKIWYLSNVLRKTVDTLEYFGPKTNTFRIWRSNNFEMFCLEILHCSNMLGTNMILFECFAQNSNTPQTSLVEIQHSSNFSAKIKYFVNVLEKDSILCEYFAYNFDILRMCWAKNIYFQKFWAEDKYSWNVLIRKGYFLNIFCGYSISFWCFGSKSNIYRMVWIPIVIQYFLIFWIQIQYFWNVLRQHGWFFEYFL